MDTQEKRYEYRYEKEPGDMEEWVRKDAMRYRRLKFFLDDLVVMDKKRGALHFEHSTDFDSYVDGLTISTGPLTAKDVTAHALNILEGQLKMTSEENRK